MKRTQPRKNRRKGQKHGGRSGFLTPVLRGLKIIGAMGLLAATSGLFVLIHDVITQCTYFAAQRIIVEGERQLSEQEIVEYAHVKKGNNILDVNLTLTRKRLLTHPWIADAYVARDIPSGLMIRINEHVPLAIVDLGRKFILNEKGQLFKQWTPADPSALPLVTGLEMSDLTAPRRTERASTGTLSAAETESQQGQRHPSPLEAVLHVLRLGKQGGSALPVELIQQIQVDREIGLTVYALTPIKTITLGYDHYAGKYAMLKHVFTYLKNKPNFPDLDRIDLNNLNRIVVSPKKHGSLPAEKKEV